MMCIFDDIFFFFFYHIQWSYNILSCGHIIIIIMDVIMSLSWILAHDRKNNQNHRIRHEQKFCVLIVTNNAFTPTKTNSSSVNVMGHFLQLEYHLIWLTSEMYNINILWYWFWYYKSASSVSAVTFF